MHKLLARQLKRALDLDPDRLGAVYSELEQLTSTGALSPQLAAVMRGLPGFLDRVDEAYVQNDRDLDLKTRGLELSSHELNESNTRLRHELSSRMRAIEALRTSALGLMDSADLEHAGLAHNNLDDLSTLMSSLVQEKKESERDLQLALVDLAHQKFALDQHAIVSTTDVHGNIIYANDKLCEVSGYARAELIGQNHRIINSGTQPPEFFANLWRTIVAGKVWHGEICNRNKSGNLYWVNATIVPLQDGTGAPTMFIAIRTDITARKRMEASVQAAEARLLHITNTIPGVVYQCEIVADQLRYTFVSERVREIRGIERDAVLADPRLTTRQILADDLIWVQREVSEATRLCKPWSGEYRIQVRDGSLRWIRTEMIPEQERTANGGTVFTGIWLDITQQKMQSPDYWR
jgi:two-component system sensor histidine kinase/response regulator